MLRSGNDSGCVVGNLPLLDYGRLDRDSGQSRSELAFALREFLQSADGFTWIRTYSVIRAHVGATNHPLLVDDVSCGHRQPESVLSVELVQLVSELQINRLEVIGKHENEAKLTRYLQPTVRQYIETQIEATMDRASVPLQLRRDCYQARSQPLYIR